MTKYVVSKDAEGELTGISTYAYYEKFPDLFCQEGETVVEFEAPDNVDAPELKELAEKALRG